jgi:hypothetical protein
MNKDDNYYRLRVEVLQKRGENSTEQNAGTVEATKDTGE